MLWKSKGEGGSVVENGVNGHSQVPKATTSHKEKNAGIVIYPFKNHSSDDPSISQHFLSLELGDSVLILNEPAPGWLYGWKKFFPNIRGLFPSSHIAQPKREFSDILEKISEVCREWGEIRRKLFVDGHLYQFEHIGRGIFELIEGRRALLNQSLTLDQCRELTRKLCSRIDWGNRKLGLDLIPWSWLIEDFFEEKEKGNDPKGGKGAEHKILPECNKDAGKLFKIHQRSIESAASRGSSTLSRPKSKNKEANNDLYVCLRDFSYSFTDDCEISFSLFDGKRLISERHTIHQNHTHLPQSNFHMGEAECPTIFKEVNVPNKRDLYLVIQIVRIGRMFYAENAKKFAKRRFRRPFAVGVLNLGDIERMGEGEELLGDAGGGSSEKLIKLYNSDEKDFWQLHELIISQRSIVSKIIPIVNSFSVSVFWCGAASLKSLTTTKGSSGSGGVGSTSCGGGGPVPTSNITFHKCIGFNNLIAPPGVVRNDLYLTLTSVELLEKKQNKTGGAKSCNLEVEIQVIDEDDEILLSLEGNCWRSLILHHVNSPKYNETIKFSIPIETFPKTKLRVLLRHCSTKDKNEKKMFGVGWLSLMDASGTTLGDGEHQLSTYKWTDESSLPLHSNSLPPSKDTLTLHSLMVSTKFTQNIDLVNLLKWKQAASRLKPSLQHLIASGEAVDEIVRKFLQDVLDALFTIFSDEEGNSTEYSGDVFTLLVNIFQLLRHPNYAAYRPLLHAYCREHFAAALVYKGLLLSLRHYTTVLLNSVTEDITQLIQNCYNSLQFIFKFVVQSQLLFAKATGGQLEDSFRKDVGSLIASFCQVFAAKDDASPVFVETQSILLQNFHSVYEELCRVMGVMEVCKLVCEVFSSIPLKDMAAHPLSPAKLSAIHEVVKSRLFKEHSGARALLLPVLCRHIRHHLAHREELKLCTDVLSEILIYLHELRSGEERSKAHADVDVVCTTTLEMLVQSVLVLERTTTIVGNLVTCLISLLEQMDHFHYNRLWDEFHERKPLRDLLLRVFLLFRDLIKHDVFPSDWAYMKLLTNHVILSSLQEFCQPLVTDFLKFFDVQLWTQYFTLAVTFISQPALQLETFRECKREWILEKYGDMRLSMGYQMLQLWTHLGDGERKNFIPGMIGAFLEVTMIPQEELRQVTLQTFFYDMMLTEFRLNGNIKETESNLIDRLDLLINSEEERQYGDEEYRIKFREIHLSRLDADCKKASKQLGGCSTPDWRSTCTTSIQSLSNLQQLLLDYREIRKLPLEENRDKLMQVTVNLLNFYKEEKRLEQYLRYVYKLHDLHLSAENYPEAGLTLLLHGQLLRWDREKMLPETYEPGRIQFPRQREAERKEMIYLRVLGYFDQGKVWEKGITLCKELAEQYEKRYDYTKLAQLLQTQATFYENILNQHRPEPEYFRVGYFGQGFPLFVRNKEFIFRGQEYERLAAFIQRITAEWPNAKLLQKSSPPEPWILEGPQSFLQICSVRPKPSASSVGPHIPEKVRAFYTVNDVASFQFDRRIEKPLPNGGEVDDGGNEFKSMWIERTLLRTGVEFPSALKWAEITEKNTVELSPVEFACEKMEEANSALQTLISQYPLESSAAEGGEPGTKNVNPLSMRLQGMLDAAVMGGIPKYNEAFFNEEFLKKEERSTSFVLTLIGLLQSQVKLLEEGLEAHGRLVPVGVQPLHKRLLECHLQMKSSVNDTELFIHTTLASLNNATLRRCDSGNFVRDSFRKFGGGKSIVNSPLPPVPKYCPGGKKEEVKNSHSNRSSVSSGGYGHVSRMGAPARDQFDDDDDDVYSQPVDDHLLSASTAAGNSSSTAAKPPLIPSRLKKGVSLPAVEPPTSNNSNDYIIMPPSRLREIVDGQNNLLLGPSNLTPTSPAPTIPPKPPMNRPSSAGGTASASPPPPLFPRKPAAAAPPTSKTSSTTSLNSGTGSCEEPPPGSPPPVPPKPRNNSSSIDLQNTYMNKDELLAQMDSLNRNGSTKASSLDTVTTTATLSKRRSDHKEYFVPPGAAKDRNSTASN